jgi:hypothetical protein
MNHSIKDLSNLCREIRRIIFKHLNKGLPKRHTVSHYLNIWKSAILFWYAVILSAFDSLRRKHSYSRRICPHARPHKRNRHSLKQILQNFTLRILLKYTSTTDL